MLYLLKKVSSSNIEKVPIYDTDYIITKVYDNGLKIYLLFWKVVDDRIFISAIFRCSNLEEKSRLIKKFLNINGVVLYNYGKYSFRTSGFIKRLFLNEINKKILNDYCDVTNIIDRYLMMLAL